MKKLLPAAIAAALCTLSPSILAAPSDKALENADSNASFLRCGTEHPSAAQAASLEKRFRDRLQKRMNAKKPDRPGGGNGNGGGGGGGGGEEPPPPEVPGAGSIVIDTYVNIICDNNGNNCAGTEGQVLDQMQVLNSAFIVNSPYQFQLVGQIRRFNNSAWLTAGPGSSAEASMKSALRQGDRGRDAGVRVLRARPGHQHRVGAAHRAQRLGLRRAAVRLPVRRARGPAPRRGRRRCGGDADPWRRAVPALSQRADRLQLPRGGPGAVGEGPRDEGRHRARGGARRRPLGLGRAADQLPGSGREVRLASAVP